MRKIKVGVILLVVCAALAWCFFPIRFSGDCSRAFNETDAESRRELVNLLYSDYWQHAENGDTFCYNVVYEENEPTALIRRGKLKEIKVTGEEAILGLLKIFPETLLTEIEDIYVSPNRIKFCSYMSIEYIFYQERVPWTFFSEKGTNNFRLYWLTKDWYYSYSTAK